MPANNTPFVMVFLLFLGLLRFDSIPGIEARTIKLGSVPGVYVFGDSLVDAGNNNHLPFSVAKANYPHNGIDFPNKKPTGRFSNGKTAADALAEKFGLPLPPPYLSLSKTEREIAAVTGVNFASGNAGILNSTEQFPGQTVPLSQQLNHWLSVHQELTTQLPPSQATIHLSRSLFVVVIGSNDLLHYLRSSKLRQRIHPQQYTQLMADKLKEQLKIIHKTGGHKFLVFGIAKIGCMPSRRDKNSMIHECDEEANMLASYEEANMLASLYNEALIKMLGQLTKELQSPMIYSYFDLFKSLHDIIANPARYGFTNVASACCGSGKLNADLPCLPITKYCTDRAKYLFWDRYGHPTHAAAQTVVNFMFTDSSKYLIPLSITQLVSY